MDSRRQAIILILTVAYFFVELLGGLYYRSLALVTDASFMAINIAGQLIAIYVVYISGRKPTKSNTFGYERAKVLSGLFNGILVGFILFYVVINAYQKIMNPQPVEADKVLFIALIGLAVNAYGFISFYQHSADMNLRGALLLISNDALGSVGVIISSLIIKFTHFSIVDPLTAVIISLFVAYPTYFLVRDSVHILMEGNPTSVSAEEVKQFIYDNFQNATSVKEIYIWGLSSERVMCAVRVRSNGLLHHREAIKSLKKLLAGQYGFSDIFIEEYEANGDLQQLGNG